MRSLSVFVQNNTHTHGQIGLKTVLYFFNLQSNDCPVLNTTNKLSIPKKQKQVKLERRFYRKK